MAKVGEAGEMATDGLRVLLQSGEADGEAGVEDGVGHGLQHGAGYCPVGEGKMRKNNEKTLHYIVFYSYIQVV